MEPMESWCTWIGASPVTTISCEHVSMEFVLQWKNQSSVRGFEGILCLSAFRGILFLQRFSFPYYNRKLKIYFLMASVSLIGAASNPSPHPPFQPTP